MICVKKLTFCNSDLAKHRTLNSPKHCLKGISKGFSQLQVFVILLQRNLFLKRGQRFPHQNNKNLQSKIYQLIQTFLPHLAGFYPSSIMQEPAFHLNSKVVASLRDRQANNDNNNNNKLVSLACETGKSIMFQQRKTSLHFPISLLKPRLKN